jgi:CubicO group peptidase (beta-lactamase class C family)
MIKKLTLLSFIFLFSFIVKAQSALTKLDSIDISAKNGIYPNLDAVIISQHKKIVFQSYYNAQKKDSLHDTRSAFKSLTAILIGIAIDKGFIKSVNQKVYDFFPDYQKPAVWDKRKDSLTIEHLLTMKSGFNCEEWNGDKDCEDEMEATNDWIKFCLDLDFKNNPGSKWDYTSINAMILGGVIANSSRMSVSEFAEKYLFNPLKIIKYRWTKDPLGHETTAGSFYMSPADMLKIGEVVLNNGVYNEERIVSAKWIEQITQRITLIENFSNVRISKNKQAIPQPTYYGYMWYNEQVKTEKLDYNLIFASGNGGQYIIVAKELDLVVAFTGNSYNSSKSKLPFDVMIKYVLPAFQTK